MLAHVLTVGKSECKVKLREGRGANPNGGSYGIPVVMSANENLKEVSLNLTSPSVPEQSKRASAVGGGRY